MVRGPTRRQIRTVPGLVSALLALGRDVYVPKVDGAHPESMRMLRLPNMTTAQVRTLKHPPALARNARSTRTHALVHARMHARSHATTAARGMLASRA